MSFRGRDSHPALLRRGRAEAFLEIVKAVIAETRAAICRGGYVTTFPRLLSTYMRSALG